MELSTASDIWSLGLVLFQLFAGEHVVTKDFIKQLTVATVATNHAMLVDEILADCWSKDHRPLLAAMLRGAPADRDR